MKDSLLHSDSNDVTRNSKYLGACEYLGTVKVKWSHACGGGTPRASIGPRRPVLAT
jgi:hypothetical protein